MDNCDGMSELARQIKMRLYNVRMPSGLDANKFDDSMSQNNSMSKHYYISQRSAASQENSRSFKGNLDATVAI